MFKINLEVIYVSLIYWLLVTDINDDTCHFELFSLPVTEV